MTTDPTTPPNDGAAFHELTADSSGATGTPPGADRREQAADDGPLLADSNDAQLVAVLDGPLAGQWFTWGDWQQRRRAAQHTLQACGHRSPALDYLPAGYQIANPVLAHTHGWAAVYRPTAAATVDVDAPAAQAHARTDSSARRRGDHAHDDGHHDDGYDDDGYDDDGYDDDGYDDDGYDDDGYDDDGYDDEHVEGYGEAIDDLAAAPAAADPQTPSAAADHDDVLDLAG
jgi:hypothetical protein